LKLKDDLPAAIAEWNESLRLDPRLADAHYSLGVTLWQSGDFIAAAEQLQAVIRIQPDYAEAYYTLGTVYKQMKKYPESADALRTAIQLQPDLAGAHITLASILRQLGDDAGADTEAMAGARLSQEKTSLQAATFATNSGKKLLANGDLDGAISQFRAAINSAPSYGVAHYELGLALAQKGQKDESDREFQRASELDPHLIQPR
jgi:superkiller protein 3